MNTIFLNLKVDSSQINFLSSIIDSYEGVATVRTVDASRGLVQLWVMPHFITETKKIIECISKSIGLIEMKTGDKMYVG